MVWLLTLLLSAIFQVFLVHNYTFQMANNAYYRPVQGQGVRAAQRP